MSSPPFEAFGLDDAVKMAAGKGGGALHSAVYPTFGAQQCAPRDHGLRMSGEFCGEHLAGMTQPSLCIDGVGLWYSRCDRGTVESTNSLKDQAA